MRQKKFFVVIVWLVIAVITCGTAFATLLELYTLKRLTLESNAIVLGKAVSAESRIDNKVVYTYTRFVVEDVIVGGVSVGDTIVVRQRGGKVGKYVVATLGDAKFTIGNRYLLFLRKSGDEWTLTAMAQAAYRCFEKDGQWWVENRLNVPRLNRSTGKVLHSPILTPKPLDEVLDTIRTILENASPATNGDNQ